MEFLYWNNCLIRICLDCVLPIYESLGLTLSNKFLFQKLLKKRVEKNLTGQEFPWLKETIVKEFMTDINENLQPADYNNFICFATTIFDNRGDEWIEWRNWKDCFLMFLFSKALDIETKFKDMEILIKKENLAKSYKEFSLNKSVDTYFENLYNNIKLTDWDKKIFAIAKFDEHSDYNDPFLQLDFTLQMNKFQIFWEKYVLSMTETELHELYQLCNMINLSRNTKNSFVDWKDKSNQIKRVEVMGNVFNNLKKPNSMRRCVAIGS